MVWHCILIADSACWSESSCCLQETLAAPLQWCFGGQGAAHGAASAAEVFQLHRSACKLILVVSTGLCAAQGRWV